MPLTVWITTNYGIFLKRWKYQTTLSVSWETYMLEEKQQLELNMEHRLVQNWERSTSRLYMVTLLTKLIYRVHHEKCQIGWVTSWNQDFWEKYQQPQICIWYHFNGRRWRVIKEPLVEGGRGEWKSWLKTQHSKNEDRGIQSYHFMANRWGKCWNSVIFHFLGLQNQCRWWL